MFERAQSQPDSELSVPFVATVDSSKPEESGFRFSFLEPIGWATITAVVGGVAYAILRPTSCADEVQCVEIVQETSPLYHAFAVTGLGTVLLHELASLFLSYRSVQSAKGVLGNLTAMLLPSALLCVSFIVLLAENLIMLVSPTPWFAHSTRLLSDGGVASPVYTNFYIEWLINVPILLVLAGKYALSLPFEDIALPIIVTNIYIILAWSCYFITNDFLRWAVVALSFIMYAWASIDMVKWVVKFVKENPESRSGLYLRPFLTVALIIIFGIYGIVFLGRFKGITTAKEERLFYTFMDIGSKLLVSMVFTGVRSSQYHAMLLDMLVNTNTVFQRRFN